MKTPHLPLWRALASPSTFIALVCCTSLAAAQGEPDDGDKATAGEDPALPVEQAPGEEAADTGAATDGQADGKAAVGLEAALAGDGQVDVAGDSDAELAHTRSSTEGDTTPDDPSSGLGVIRLPEAAYPEPQPRGIRGGSLWFTLHGLQWPYMPMHGASPGLMVGVSGLAWVDPSYATETTTEETVSDETRFRTQGRFALRLTPTYSMPDDWFVQGQAELVANSDQVTERFEAPDTDDLWLRAGQWNKWDVQLGRFEGWEVYHFGMGLDLHSFERTGTTLGPSGAAPPIYGATFGYYRDSVGNLAAHIYPLDILRFEVLGKFGSRSGVNQVDENTFGGRPVAVLDLGMIKAKLGGEYIKRTQVQDRSEWERVERGVGTAVQFVLDPLVEAGVNGGYGLVDTYDELGELDQENTFMTYSFGGFANARVVEALIVGAGGHYTWKDDQLKDVTGREGEFDHLQVFGAVQYVVFDQLYLKLVGAYSRGRFAPTSLPIAPYDSTMLSGRLRASLYF